MGWTSRAIAISCAAASIIAANGSTSAQAWEPKGAQPARPSQSVPFATAALTPPAAKLEQEAALPKPLRAADAERYRRIFALQRHGNWGAADAEIARLTDRSLMGTVLAQRYLHPTAWRSSYAELKAWLDRYSDHADAPRIHALALKRVPAGAARPARPQQTVAPSGGGLPDFDVDAEFAYAPPKEAGKGTGPAALRLRSAIEADFAEQRFDAVLKRIDASTAARLVETAELDWYRARLAAQWYYRGDIDRAFELSRIAAKRSGAAVPMAYWTAGLSAWRLGKLAEARRWFEALAETPKLSPWIVSAAAYWASRVHLKAKRPQLVSHWLALAAEHPRTFYGLLARRSLKLPPRFDWDQRALTSADVEMLLQKPGGRRAAGLLQAGELKLAERELEVLAFGAGRELGRAVLSLAQRANLAQLAIRLGPRIADKDGRRHDAALYPIPSWKPQGGFAVDRALIYAFMRQESGFRPDARSPAGALGLMQLMPATASYVARKAGLPADADPLDPAVNMALGQHYILELFAHEAVRGDLFRLVAAYNSGPGKLEQWHARQDLSEDPLLFIESIPSRETRLFIERVLASYWIYRYRLGQPTPSLDAIAAGEWPTYTPLESGAQAVAQNGED